MDEMDKVLDNVSCTVSGDSTTRWNGEYNNDNNNAVGRYYSGPTERLEEVRFARKGTIRKTLKLRSTILFAFFCEWPGQCTTTTLSSSSSTDTANTTTKFFFRRHNYYINDNSGCWQGLVFVIGLAPSRVWLVGADR
jgi:hypothetical protein